MKRNYLLLSLLFFSTSAISQNSKSKAIEFTFLLRHELQGSYTAQYGTAPYLNSLKLYGTSIGADIGYKVWSGKGWYFAPSFGYYSFSIGKIINRTIPTTPLSDDNGRFIDYQPDSTPFGYATRGYHYNNLSLGIRAGKEFRLNERYQVTTGIVANYLFSYSAKYKVARTHYRTSDFRSFGYMLTGQLGISRKYQKFYAAAHVLLPLYKQWKKDKGLFENPDESVQTLFGGYGISFTIGKYLK